MLFIAKWSNHSAQKTIKLASNSHLLVTQIIIRQACNLNHRLKLGRNQRLRRPADYRRVYQSKQWGGSSHHSFNVLAIDKPGSLGVTVSKKVSKSAVVRNRIKRQTKEFYRLRQHELVEGVELVITAKPSCAKAADLQRLDSLLALWEKILKWQCWHRKNTAGLVRH